MMEPAAIPHLREIVIFLAAAGIVVPVFQRARVSPILGFLAVGVAVGPNGLGQWSDQLGVLHYLVIADVDGAAALAELGIVFLLFMLGLELSPESLLSLLRLVFGLGLLHVVVTSAAIGAIADLRPGPRSRARSVAVRRGGHPSHFRDGRGEPATRRTRPRRPRHTG
jgi:CPA2 family monovalent cation:H+ antiporter-2